MARERVLVVGAGGISNAWFRPIKAERLRVVGVVDLDVRRAESRIAEHGFRCPAFTDLRDALRRTEPRFVVDVTVPEAHCGVTCAALKAGCHVIGEKPMASTMADARRMVRAAAKSGNLYMVSQSRRWDALTATVSRAVRGGRIGDLTTVNCDFYIGAHFDGFRNTMASPLVLDMAIHHFDLVRFMTGKDPVAVYAHEFHPRGSWYDGAAAATCVFEMTDGVVFTYRGSWCAEGCHTSWNGDWRLAGTRGTLLYERDQPPTGQVVTGKTGFFRKLRDIAPARAAMRHTQMHGGLREMLTFLRKGTHPQTECHDNIKSLAMVHAAIESAAKGKRVAVRW